MGVHSAVGALCLPAVAALSWLPFATDGSFAATKPEPMCTPEGSSLTVSAKNNIFDKDCLAAPADTPFTISFDNQDYDIHNVSLYDAKGGGRRYSKARSSTGRSPSGTPFRRRRRGGTSSAAIRTPNP